jgi:flagellin
MSSIGTNVSALIANTNLAKSQSSLSKSIERLSSGLKINSGADDPSGLIISEQLQAEIQGISTAINNSTQATNVISTADAALAEVSNLLVSIKGLVVQAANTGGESSDEIQANQLQVNSAIDSITRIANSTSFAGTHLLDGSLGYVTSGVTASALHDVNVTTAAFGTQKTIPVSVNVFQSAQTAILKFNGAAIPTAPNASSTTLNITGANGTQSITFASGATSTEIVQAINRISDSTGVTAALTSAGTPSLGVTFSSTGYGSSQFVTVTSVNNSAFTTTDAAGNTQQTTHGRDVSASVNGIKANGNGLNISVNTASLSLSLNVDADFGKGSEQFVITGGGATFQLGAQVQSNQQVSIGIGSVAANQLGSATDGYLSDIESGGSADLATDPAKASQIVDDAINQVSVLRGRLGAFESNTLQTNVNSLQVALENVTSSNSTIEDTDFASETSNLTRQQILVQAGTSVLATANSTPQSVLKLLQ